MKATQTGPISGRLRQINPYDAERQEINALVAVTTPGLAKLSGETGTLSDVDIALYRSAFGGDINTQEAIDLLQNQLLAKVDQSINSVLDIYDDIGYDLGDIPVRFNRGDLSDTVQQPQQDYGSDQEFYSELERLFQEIDNQ